MHLNLIICKSSFGGVLELVLTKACSTKISTHEKLFSEIKERIKRESLSAHVLFLTVPLINGYCYKCNMNGMIVTIDRKWTVTSDIICVVSSTCLFCLIGFAKSSLKNRNIIQHVNFYNKFTNEHRFLLFLWSITHMLRQEKIIQNKWDRFVSFRDHH